jgi:hypothetical protein
MFWTTLHQKHKKQKKTQTKGITSFSAQQKKQSLECRDDQQNGRKYLQTVRGLNMQKM